MFLSLKTNEKEMKGVEEEHERRETEHADDFVHDSQEGEMDGKNIDKSEQNGNRGKKKRISQKLNNLIIIAISINHDISFDIDSKNSFPKHSNADIREHPNFQIEQIPVNFC